MPEVFEDEHFRADARAQFVVRFLDGDEERLAEVFLEGVEQIGGGLQSARLVQAARVLDAGFMIEDFDDFLDDLDGRGRQRGNALDDLLAGFLWEMDEELRAFLRSQVAHDEGDGLRLLVLDEVVNGAWLHVGQGLHGRDGGAPGGDASEDAGGAVGADGFFERGLRVIDAAKNGGAGFVGDVGEFPEQVGLGLVGNHRDFRHLGGHGFELGFAEILHDLPGGIGADDDEEGGQFLQLGHLRDFERNRF